MSNEVKVGILTIVAIIIFIIGYNYLKGKNLFSSQEIYFAEYDNVNGLLTANPILLNGFQVGIVDGIWLKEDNSGKIMVRYLMNQSLQIPDTSTFEIVGAGLLGDKAVKLTLGQNKQYATSGDTLRGKSEVNLVDFALEQVAPIKEQGERLMTSIDSTLQVIKKLAKSDEIEKVMKNIAQTTKSVQNTLASAEKLTKNLSEFTDKDLGKVSEILANTKELSTDMKGKMGKVDGILDQAGTAMTDVKNMTGNAKQLISKAENIVKKVDNSAGSMEKIASDAGQMVQKANQMVAKTDKIIDKTDKIIDNTSGMITDAGKVTKNALTISDQLAAAELDKTIQEAQTMLNELSSITEQIKNGEGNVGQLLNNDSLYNNIEDITNNVNELILDFKANPKDYVGFSLINFGGGKKKRKRKQEEERKRKLEQARKQKQEMATDTILNDSN